MSAAVDNDVESLFSEVGQVQKALQDFGLTRPVDGNEIFELLESYSLLPNRVNRVISHFVQGGSENVVEVSDESSSDNFDNNVYDDYNYTPSPEYDLPSMPDPIDVQALDLSVNDPDSDVNSLIRETIEIKNHDSNFSEDTLNGVELAVSCTTSIFPEKLPLSPSNANGNEGSEAAVYPASSSDTAATYSESKSDIKKDDSENVSSFPAFQNDDFLYDVNNNDPNNNTEYGMSLEDENIDGACGNKEQEQQEQSKPHQFQQEDAKPSTSYTCLDDCDSDVQSRIHKQDDIRQKLLEEARLIGRIVPRQSVEQIYSFLETNVDHPNRLQIVMNEFLQMELAVPETSQADPKANQSGLAETDGESQRNTSCVGSPNSLKRRILESSNENLACSEEQTLNQKRLMEMESQPSTPNPESPVSLKRTLERADKLDDESSCSPQHSKVRRQSTGQETELVPQSFNASIDQTENKGEVECSKEGGAAILSTEFEVDVSIIDPLTVKSESLYETEETSIGTSHNTEAYNAITHIINPPDDNTVRYDASLLPPVSPKRENIGTDSQILPPVHEKKIELTDEEMKYKSMIMEMFPDADPLYLKQECAGLRSEEAVNVLISNMLQNPYPIRKQETLPIDDPQPGPSAASESYDDRIERQFETLREILPNADPSFLRETCITIGSNEDQMKAFITDALEKKNYPTLEEYKKRQNALSLQEKYTKEFKVEEFLEIFPDPFKYFLEEKKTQETMSKYALPYLKSRYRKIRAQDLQSTLQKCQYNLTQTCLQLDSFKGTLLKAKRGEFDCKQNIPLEVSIPFLQEIAFIENKKKISSYQQEKEDKRKATFLEAKSKGELLECGCCFDNEVMAEDMATCREGHLFCKECIRKAAEVKIGDGETKFPCLSDCGTDFDLMTLQNVLKPSVFSKMLQRKQIEEVKAAGIEDLETCPYCDFASIPPREDKVFRCLNPDCMKETCRKCREPSHIPLRCEEVEKADEVKIRTSIENRMTEALIRTCWKCGKKFIKESGCNKMTCTCGALMCYICRKPVRDYNHFNGQGGDNFHKCPLYSKDDELHVNPVHEEAKKAKEELKALNPNVNLKHDPTSNLPAPVQQNHNVNRIQMVNNIVEHVMHRMPGGHGRRRQGDFLRMRLVDHDYAPRLPEVRPNQAQNLVLNIHPLVLPRGNNQPEVHIQHQIVQNPRWHVEDLHDHVRRQYVQLGRVQVQQNPPGRIQVQQNLPAPAQLQQNPPGPVQVRRDRDRRRRYTIRVQNNPPPHIPMHQNPPAHTRPRVKTRVQQIPPAAIQVQQNPPVPTQVQNDHAPIQVQQNSQGHCNQKHLVQPAIPFHLGHTQVQQNPAAPMPVQQNPPAPVEYDLIGLPPPPPQLIRYDRPGHSRHTQPNMPNPPRLTPHTRTNHPRPAQCAVPGEVIQRCRDLVEEVKRALRYENSIENHQEADQGNPREQPYPSPPNSPLPPR